MSFVLIAGCEDDDRGGAYFHDLLAALPHVLHRHLSHARDHQHAVHSGHLPVHLLASHVQLYVQPHHLLLDEPQVRPTDMCVHKTRYTKFSSVNTIY